MILQNLKEEVAQDNGFVDWEQVVSTNTPKMFNLYLDILVRRYAELMVQHNLNRAADQALSEWAYGKIVGVDKGSIRSTEIELL